MHYVIVKVLTIQLVTLRLSILKVIDGVVALEKVYLPQNCADIFTKPMLLEKIR